MKKRNENELTMFVLIQNYVLGLPEEVKDAMPTFDNVFTVFNNSVTSIGNLNGELSAKGLGYKIEKMNTKQTMVETAIVVSNAIRAYALVNNDTVLANNFKHTYPKLVTLRDTTAYNTCSFIHQKAVEMQDEIGDYGITTAILTSLENQLTSYLEKLAQPRQNIVDRKLVNQQIDSLFKTSKNQLFLMDALVTTIKDTNPEVYNKYFNDRKVINTGSRKMAIRGYVKNQLGNPLEGATVRVADGPSTKTTELGYYEFKSLPEGVQKFIFEYPGLTTVEQYITIMKGQRMDFNITLDNNTNEARVS